MLHCQEQQRMTLDRNLHKDPDEAVQVQAFKQILLNHSSLKKLHTNAVKFTHDKQFVKCEMYRTINHRMNVEAKCVTTLPLCWFICNYVYVQCVLLFTIVTFNVKCQIAYCSEGFLGRVGRPLIIGLAEQSPAPVFLDKTLCVRAREWVRENE